METILALDRQLFFFIHQLPRFPLVDQFALLLSGVGTWGVVWLLIAVYLFFREEKKDHRFFLPALFVVVCGIISEFFIKTLIGRPRPTDILETFSFPSSHAVLAFAFAYILSYEEPKWSYWLYTLAVLISLSRVYLGVHYPLDILGGAFLGIIIGWFSLTLKNFVQKK